MVIMVKKVLNGQAALAIVPVLAVAVVAGAVTEPAD